MNVIKTLLIGFALCFSGPCYSYGWSGTIASTFSNPTHALGSHNTEGVLARELNSDNVMSLLGQRADLDVHTFQVIASVTVSDGGAIGVSLKFAGQELTEDQANEYRKAAEEYLQLRGSGYSATYVHELIRSRISERAHPDQFEVNEVAQYFPDVLSSRLVGPIRAKAKSHIVRTYQLEDGGFRWTYGVLRDTKDNVVLIKKEVISKKAKHGVNVRKRR